MVDWSLHRLRAEVEVREGASGPVFVTILTDGACTTVGKLPKSEGNRDQIRREIQTQIQIQIQIHIQIQINRLADKSMQHHRKFAEVRRADQIRRAEDTVLAREMTGSCR